jgi:hypothetical protein
MGVIVRFRGTIQDPSLVETFEDRIVELALECEGYARIWRSASKAKPERVIRGILLNLAPGLDTVSLLLSPEGWLLPMHAVEDAEEGRGPGRPWVPVQTRFGPLRSHVMLVAMLETLKQEFFPDLEIEDEGGYWPAHDAEALRRSRDGAGGGPAPVAEALPEEFSRLVASVRRTLERPPEHAPVRFADADNPAIEDDRLGSEAEWDALYKQNERRDARLMRALDEKSLHGDLKDGDFEAALQDEGIAALPGIDDDEEEDEPPARGVSPAWKDPPPGQDADDGAPWADSLREPDADGDDADEPEDSPREQHPVLRRASELLLKVMKIPERAQAGPANPLDPMIKGLMEMSGGLAQVLGGEDEEGGDGPFGYTLMQLKRSQRGIAHARGAVAPAREAGLITADFARLVAGELAAIEREVQAHARKIRESM